MSGYFKDSDWDNYIKTAMLYFNKYSMLDPMITNDIAWTLTQKTDNKDILHKTETIIAELLKQHADYETFDTYAFILFKLEKKDEAKKAAETAIELAKKSNKDFSSTLELLDKLK
jgi:predicted RNA polymerase sigma factor